VGELICFVEATSGSGQLKCCIFRVTGTMLATENQQHQIETLIFL
jgi:hypothetical protein